MNRERFQQVKAIFLDACERAPTERAQYLDEVCGQDAALRAAVEEQLAGDEHPVDELDRGGLRLQLEQLLNEGAGELHGEADGSPEPPPERIGRYKIIRTIAEGGMGTVFEAEQEHPRRRVALKVIRPGMASPAMLRRFEQEALVLGRLQHPGITQIYEAGLAQIGLTAGTRSAAPLKQPFFAMEFIQGRPIDEYVTEQALATRERLELLAKVCDAVYHAHQKGIVHRDLKPGNILVDETGQPKVLDFGVARVTNADVQTVTMQTTAGQLVGTLCYMSPEQVTGRSDALDTRSDVYALGVILYELLSGKLPYDVRERSVPEAARIVRERDPSRLSSIDTRFRGDVETIVSKALEKDRDRRYPSAAEFAADIRRYLSDRPIVARPPSTFYQFRKFAKRNKALAGGVAIAFVALALGLTLTTTFAIREARQRRLADRHAEQSRANESRALASEATARWKAYRASIAAASFALALHNPRTAEHHLHNAPEEFRNWEWRHLSAQLDPGLVVYEGDAQSAVEGYSARIAYRNDGTPLGALLRHGTVVLVDLTTGTPSATFPAPYRLAAPCLAQDGSRLAAFCETGENLLVWDTTSGRLLLQMPLDGDDPRLTRFSPDGSLLALISRTGNVKVMEVATGRPRLASHPGLENARAVAFSRDASRIVICQMDQQRGYPVTVWDTRTGARLCQRIGFVDACGSLAFSRDGTRIAFGSDERLVRILDAATLEDLDILRGQTGRVSAVTFSHDDTRLASAASDGTIRIWDLATRQPLHSLNAEREVDALAFSPDGTMIVSCGRSGIRMWDWAAGPALKLTGHTSFVAHAAYSPDGAMIASGGWTRTVRLWNAHTGEPRSALPISEGWRSVVHGLGFSADGSRLVVLASGNITVWDPTSGQPIAAPDSLADEAPAPENAQSKQPIWYRYLRSVHGGSTYAGDEADAATSRDGSLIAWENGRDGIVVEELATRKVFRRLQTPGCDALALAFSPDNARIAAGCEDHSVRVWDIATGAELAVMKGHTARVYTVSFSPDGTRIVSGGNDNVIILWDSHSFEQVAELQGHTSYVHSVAFSPDGSQIVSGSGDFTVRIWDTIPHSQRHGRSGTLAAPLRPRH